MMLHADAATMRDQAAPTGAPGFAFREAPEAAVAVTPPDRHGWVRRLLRRPLFVAVVLVPNLLSILYFGLIAAPVYTSTASLMVMSPKQSGPSLSSLLAGASGDSSEQGGYILKSYFGSWNAFRTVGKPLDLGTHFREGDFVARYGGLLSAFRSNDVALWRYFQRKVDVEIDQKSGIVSLNVDAFDPAFATRLTRALLDGAVRHMDAMNADQERDLVRTATARKATIEAALQRDLAALARYRSETGTYDPKELYLANLSLMNSYAMKEADLKSQRDAIARSIPNNPQADNLAAMMASVRGQMASAAGSFPAVARGSAGYERLLVSRDTHVTMLSQANLALQDAEASAERSRYYLNVISSPSEPQTPEQPRRLLWVGGVLLVSLLLWGLLR